MELDGKPRVNRLTLTLDREGRVFPNLCGYFGTKKVLFPEIASIENVKKNLPYKAYERRLKMKK